MPIGRLLIIVFGQDEGRHVRLERCSTTLSPCFPIRVHHVVVEFRFEADARPCVEEFPPIASLCCRGQVSISKHGRAVFGDPLGFRIVVQEVFHFFVEIREVAFNFHDVLVYAFGNEEVGVGLDPFWFVNDREGGAIEEVFSATAVGVT